MAEQGDVRWARETAAALLVRLGRRWAHTLGVVERARSLAAVLPASELDVLVAAAYLHDPRLRSCARQHRLGLPSARRGTLPPSRRARATRLLVAHHVGARTEAQERRLLDSLDRFPIGRH